MGDVVHDLRIDPNPDGSRVHVQLNDSEEVLGFALIAEQFDVRHVILRFGFSDHYLHVDVTLVDNLLEQLAMLLVSKRLLHEPYQVVGVKGLKYLKP